MSLSNPDVNTMGQHHAQAGDTERGAAQRVMPRTGTQRRQVLDAFAAAPDGLTDHEAAAATGLFLYSAAPRRTELVAGGWLTDSGRRRDTPNGAPAIVWTMTAAGRAELGQDPMNSHVMTRLEIMEQVVTCENCELHEGCAAPVFGTIPTLPATVAIVGEAPGEQEDDQGRPFIGPAGQLLRRLLADANINPDVIAYINTVSCWPHGTPTWDHVHACHQNKMDQLALVNPRVVIPVGKVAVKGFRPWLNMKHGRARPWVQDGYVLAATYHPAAALRNGNYEEAMVEDLQHIAKIIAADDGKPWDSYPAWLDEFTADTCAGCNVEMLLMDSDGLGWCEVHMPDHMQDRLLAYKERYPG